MWGKFKKSGGSELEMKLKRAENTHNLWSSNSRLRYQLLHLFVCLDQNIAHTRRLSRAVGVRFGAYFFEKNIKSVIIGAKVEYKGSRLYSKQLLGNFILYFISLNN